MNAQLTKVATRAEIAPGTAKVVDAGGAAIAIFNCGGSYYATENSCKHRGGPLGEGAIAGTTVTCPWHGWQFDVSSGQCQMDPAIKVRTFPVTVQGEDILISI